MKFQNCMRLKFRNRVGRDHKSIREQKNASIKVTPPPHPPLNTKHPETRPENGIWYPERGTEMLLQTMFFLANMLACSCLSNSERKTAASLDRATCASNVRKEDNPQNGFVSGSYVRTRRSISRETIQLTNYDETHFVNVDGNRAINYLFLISRG